MYTMLLRACILFVQIVQRRRTRHMLQVSVFQHEESHGADTPSGARSSQVRAR